MIGSHKQNSHNKIAYHSQMMESIEEMSGHTTENNLDLSSSVQEQTYGTMEQFD